MKNKTAIILISLIILGLTSCGAKSATPPVDVAAATSVPVTITPDLCSKENLPNEVSKVNSLMREFDDYSKLASSTPQGQLVQIVPPMQEIRRRAEDQNVPECLTSLKTLQINHMNAVIETLMVFMSNPKSENIGQGITQARELHLKYDTEIARLLGLTLVPSTPVVNVPPTETPIPQLSVLNPGPKSVTLYVAPDSKSGGVAMLEAGQTAIAFGQTADGKWIKVEVPGQAGQRAWVEAALVQASGQLPEIAP
jgi:hypothetical protein